MSMRPLIIAAPSANCGKTELACRLIRAMPAAQALKITRFHRESHCPVHGVDEHGEDNCDGCAPVPSGFELVEDEETLTVPGKDSTRMIEAGAAPVLWLRAAPHVFRYALQHAMKRFDPSRPLILEGNSAATVAGFPGTVLLIWPQKSRGVKASVIPALRRSDYLFLVESDSEPARRVPRTLTAALMRQNLTVKDLPAPFWLPHDWWKRDSDAELDGLLRQIAADAAGGESVGTSPASSSHRGDEIDILA